jgi:hypothetical protein
MAKIKLLLQELNFWVDPNLTTKQGFTIKSYYVLPFFLSHDDFKSYLLDANLITHDESYIFICNDDASELNNIVSDYLTIKFNSEASVVWPFVDTRPESGFIPVKYDKLTVKDDIYFAIEEQAPSYE